MFRASVRDFCVTAGVFNVCYLRAQRPSSNQSHVLTAHLSYGFVLTLGKRYLPWAAVINHTPEKDRWRASIGHTAEAVDSKLLIAICICLTMVVSNYVGCREIRAVSSGSQDPGEPCGLFGESSDDSPTAKKPVLLLSVDGRDLRRGRLVDSVPEKMYITIRIMRSVT
jgi:hypothetical protein